MDQMSQDRKIFVMYHSPCIDGIYSLMNLMMVIKSKITYEDWTVNQIIERIEQYLEHLLKGEQDNYKCETKNLPNVQKPDFFKSSVSDRIVYFPIYFGIDKLEAYKLVLNQQNNHNYKDSIIIMLDYFGRCFSALLQVSTLFKHMIIIDHHATGFQELQQFKKFDSNISKMQHVENNIYCMMDQSRAGCQLSMAFCEDLFGNTYQNLVPAPIYCKLATFITHISDHDLYLLKLRETEPLIMAIYAEKYENHLTLRLNYQAEENQEIFQQIYDMDFVTQVKRGRKLQKQRNDKISKLLPKKQLINLGGFKGYAIESQDPSIINEIGLELANISEQDGNDNVAVVYHPQNQHSKLKIHVRSDKKSRKPVQCDLVAQQYKGGGHTNAASFTMDRIFFNRMLKQ